MSSDEENESTRQATKMEIYIADPVRFVIEELGETPSEDQAEFLRSVADLDNLHFIVSAGRGSGKSRSLAWILCWSVACLPHVYGVYNVCVVGGSLEQARAVYDYFKKYIFMTGLLSEKLISEPTMTKTDFKDSWVRCLTASEKSVRSPHPELLIFDEVCQAEENIVESALPMTGSSKHGRDILSSTPNQMYHIFKRYWDKATEYGFKRFGPWGLLKCPWIKPAVIEHARKTYSESRYATEIEGRFAKADASLFEDEDIKIAFKGEIHQAPGIPVIAGLDWGQDHPTVLTLSQRVGDYDRIIHQEEWRERKYSEMQEEICRILDDHGCRVIYADSSHSGENERLADEGYTVEAVNFKGLKDDMVENMMYRLERNKMRASKELIAFQEQLQGYHRVKTKGGKMSYCKENDDYVDSGMLAMWGLKEVGGSGQAEAGAMADVPVSF